MPIKDAVVKAVSSTVDFFCRQEVLNGKRLETTVTMYLHIVPEVLMDGLHDVLEFPSVVAVQQHSS